MNSILVKSVRPIAVLGMLALGLQGCSSSTPPPSPIAAARPANVSVQTGVAPGAGYKVGDPYQIAGTWYYPKQDFSYRETGIASWYGPGFHGRYTANGEVYDSTALTAAHRTLPMPSIVRVTNLDNGRSIKVRVNDRGPFARSRIIDVSERAAELLGFRDRGTAKVLVEVVEDESRQLASAALSDEAAIDAPRSAPVGVVSAETLPGSAPPPAQIQPGSTVQTALNVPRRQVSTVVPGAAPGQGFVTRPVGPSDIYVQAGAFTRYDNANRLRAQLSALSNVRIATAMVEDTQFFRVQLGPVDSVDAADRLLDLLLANGYGDARLVVD